MRHKTCEGCASSLGTSREKSHLLERHASQDLRGTRRTSSPPLEDHSFSTPRGTRLSSGNSTREELSSGNVTERLAPTPRGTGLLLGAPRVARKSWHLNSNFDNVFPLSLRRVERKAKCHLVDHRCPFLRNRHPQPRQRDALS